VSFTLQFKKKRPCLNIGLTRNPAGTLVAGMCRMFWSNACAFNTLPVFRLTMIQYSTVALNACQLYSILSHYRECPQAARFCPLFLSFRSRPYCAHVIPVISRLFLMSGVYISPPGKTISIAFFYPGDISVVLSV
jgi:hypothetical protein